MDAFDADVLIYAAAPGHPLGRRVRALFGEGATAKKVGIGSIILLPEILAKPMRAGTDIEVRSLTELLKRLDLLPIDTSIAELATVLGAEHGLHAIDAVHLATAVDAGADRFLTNNQRDFRRSIGQIEITYPEDLPAP